MERKDWILLILPIILNGIFIFAFQKTITVKLEQISKKNSIRDNVVMCFYEKVQNLNDTLIQANISVSNSPDSLFTELKNIHESVLEIVRYYDNNKYDLDIFENEFDFWEKSWNTFVATMQRYSNCALTPDMQRELGIQLQGVKGQTQSLMKTIREKY